MKRRQTTPAERDALEAWLRERGVYLDRRGREVEFRGACREFVRSREDQVILAGVADSGKTWVACSKVHNVALANPGANLAVVRKTYASMPGTVLVTFARVAAGYGVEVYGGERPTKYVYPNGAVVWVGGMDNPDRVLSAERDVIYVNQAEELSLDDWEVLSTRCTGRGAVVAHPQLLGDCNPGGSKHWIREASRSGSLRLLTATHLDNPTIYEKLAAAALAARFPHGPPSGVAWRDGLAYVPTDGGRKRLAVLSKLTGMRRKRLFEGVWATAEGAVYPMFDASRHVVRRDPREMAKWFLAMDEGFTNPQVCLLVGEDPDGRWHVFQEFYVTQHLESEIVAQAKGWYRDVRTAEAVGAFNGAGRPVSCHMAACDDAAPGLIASLNAAGLDCRSGKGLIGGNGKVKGGIDKIQDRLAFKGDGRARLTLQDGGRMVGEKFVGWTENTVNEFESYVWKPEKDVPADAFNHSLGALRYLEDALAEPTGAFESASGLHTGKRADVAEAVQADRISAADLG